MKVLLAGPWDLAGRYTAERFLQEGYSVCWFTREPQRRLWDHRLQGTVCRGAFARESILQVLRAHRIDTVIFLTGALREETGPRPENPARDLDELLAALQNHPVEHFVYLSSMELSWGNALTPRQAALAAGELSCRAGRDHGKLPLLIIRLAYLYGRAAPEDMGLMGSMLQAIREGRTIRCPYHPQDCIDMMHAADAARGIYRMILHGMQGTQLLASGYPLPIKTVCRCLEQAAGGTARVEWLGQRHTMPAECFDGRAVKTETGWMPYTLLQDSGWQLIREETLPSRPAAPAKEPQPSRLGPLLRRMGETLVLFVITLGLLQFGKDVSDLKYVDIRLMFVAVTACCYGGGAGLLAVVLASLSYLYELASSYVDVSYLLYSVDTWGPFVVYAVTGSVLGYLTGRRREDMLALRRKADQLAEKCDQLQVAQGETMEIKSRQEQRIVSERHSFADLYRIVQELDTLQPHQILQHTVGIVADLLDCERVSVYRMDADGTGAHLEACSTRMRGRAPAVADPRKVAALCTVFDRQTVFANTQLNPDLPDLAAAIRCGDRLYGIVAAYDLGPDHFTTYYRDLLKVVMGLIERDLVRALESYGAAPAREVVS